MAFSFRLSICFLVQLPLVLPAVILPKGFERFGGSQQKENVFDSGSKGKSSVFVVNCDPVSDKECENLFSMVEVLEQSYPNSFHQQPEAGSKKQEEKPAESAVKSDINKKKEQSARSGSPWLDPNNLKFMAGGLAVGLPVGMLYKEPIMGFFLVCLQWCTGGNS